MQSNQKQLHSTLLSLLLILLQFNSATAIICNEAEAQKTQCDIDGHITGFQCEYASNKCIPKNVRCNSFLNVSQSCEFKEQMDFGKCFAINFELEVSGTVFSYVVLKGRFGWFEAVKYCQNLGLEYEIIDLTNAAEISDLVETLNIKGIISKSELVNPHGTYSDIFHSTIPSILSLVEGLCTQDGILVDEVEISDFWLGVAYNSEKKLWHNIGNSSKILISESTQSQLKQVTKSKIKSNAPLRASVVLVADEFQFVVTQENHPRNIKIESLNKRNVMCKRIGPKSNFPLPDLGSCASGFKCPYSPVCAIGAAFVESDLCNGIGACPREADETLDHCPNYNSTDMKHNYILIGVMQTAETAKLFCESKGWTLPVINDNVEIKHIASLPEQYLKYLKASGHLQYHDVIFTAWSLPVHNCDKDKTLFLNSQRQRRQSLNIEHNFKVKHSIFVCQKSHYQTCGACRVQQSILVSVIYFILFIK